MEVADDDHTVETGDEDASSDNEDPGQAGTLEVPTETNPWAGQLRKRSPRTDSREDGDM